MMNGTRTVTDNNGIDSVIGGGGDEMFLTLVGKVDEEGLINDLFKRGVNDWNAFVELISNCIDAHSRNAIVNETDKSFRLNDDGDGMDEENLARMWNLFGSNHKEDRSIGFMGLGSKAGLAQLSEKKETVEVHTRAEGGKYLKVIAPFGKIFKKKKWKGQIVMTKMTHEDIKTFKEERTRSETATGTTIILPKNEKIVEILNNIFRETKTLPFKERLDVTLGRFSGFSMEYNKQGTPPQTLKLWNPLGGGNHEYYNGIRHIPISFYTDIDHPTKIYYVATFEGKELYCKRTKDGRVYNEPSEYSHNSRHQKILDGETTFRIGHRKDKEYFDLDKPELPFGKAVGLSPYEKGFFLERDPSTGKKRTADLEELPKMHLIRNRFQIGSIPFEGYGTYKGAGDHGQHAPGQRHRTRCELHYNPLSIQDNPSDICMGIQSIKNQYDPTNFPEELRRLCKYLRNKVVDENWAYFKKVTTEHKTAQRKRRVAATLKKIQSPLFVWARRRNVKHMSDQFRDILTKKNSEIFHDASDGSTSSTSDISYQDGASFSSDQDEKASDTPDQDDKASDTSDQDETCKTGSVEKINDKVIQLLNVNRWTNETQANAIIKAFYEALAPYHVDDDKLCTHGNMKGECSQANCEN